MLVILLALLVTTCMGAPHNYYPVEYGEKTPSYNAPQTVVVEEVQEPEVIVHTQYHAQDSLGQYSYGYASSDGSQKAEARNEEGRVAGRFAYIDPNGKKIELKYVADKEGGFRAEGDHLPEAPELPDFLKEAYQQAEERLALAKNRVKDEGLDGGDGEEYVEQQTYDDDGQGGHGDDGGDNGGGGGDDNNNGGDNGGDDQNGGDNGGHDQEEGGNGGDEQQGGDNGGDEQQGGDNGGDEQEGGDNGGDEQEGGDNGGDEQGGDNGGDEQEGGDHGGAEQEGGDHGGDEQEGGDHGGDEQEGGDHGGAEQEEGNNGEDGEGDHGNEEEEEEEEDEEGDQGGDDENENESGERGQEIYKSVYNYNYPQPVYYYAQPQIVQQEVRPLNHYDTYGQAAPQTSQVPVQYYVPIAGLKSTHENRVY